ncbi:DUF1694 domain-containing protein [Pradoshia eiseniae]|uniref:DUF1694 domain-containing protein n=1 Tax=Pradoshia eiseniae TaxID=2064768 RepID=A0A2S7N530_9BACI|nr:YueI family protein [Pradoshia eiseniae]PQD97134.1 DUF1694 domain-containing protein [Pradoshia eiseniae]
MSKKTVDDYLQEGIHGAKEIKTEERREFLGSLRERVVVALGQKTVFENKIPSAFEDILKNNTGAVLYLNGHIDYSYLSKYVKLAESHKIQFKIVLNKDYNSPHGAVLAYGYAINKEDISLPDPTKNTEKKNEKEPTGGGFSFFKKLFKKD